jgi:HAE1 family hydrophobic/amphiphilic exporter-1
MNLSAIAVRRAVFTSMVTLIAVLLGLVSMIRLPIDLLPEIEFPVLTVSVTYPNASPQVMEELVARPIEQAVAIVPGVEEITSSSSEGVTNVRMNFAWGTDLNAAANDVRDQIDRRINNLPDDADRPRIRKFDTADAPIMLVGISSGIDPIELRRIVDNQISYRLQQVSGVAAIDIWGGPEREIQVRLDPQRITALGLPLTTISNAIRDANLTRPGGHIEEGSRAFTIRVPGRFADLDELRDTVVTVRDGNPVTLSQVAQIIDGRKRETRIVRIDGDPGIRIAIRKQSETNTVEVARGVHQALERIDRDYSQIHFSPLFDTSEFIERSIANAITAMLLGALLAVVVLLFFLRSLYATLVVAVAIPVSVITTFALMYFGGLTLNLMTIGGLALGVGLMVDSAIVVLENIVRRREAYGESAATAATLGAGEVAAPIVAGTLTTLVIFVPMLFAEGITGQLFLPLAYVVAFALTCSLLAALTLVPMLSARLLPQQMGAGSGILARVGHFIGRLLTAVEQRYQLSLQAALHYPATIIAAAVLLLVAAVAAIPLLGTEFMPATDEDEVRVNVVMPSGTRLEVVERATLQALDVVTARVPEARSVVVTVGAGSFRASDGARGDVRIALPPREQRSRSSAEIVTDLRQAMVPIAAAEVRISARRPFFMRRAFGGSETGLQIEVRGFEFATLDALATQVQRQIEPIAGISNVRLSKDEGERQRLIRIDRRRAADQGVSVAAIADTVETALAGRVASRYLDSGEEVDIRVQLYNSETLPVRALLDLQVAADDGRLVRLGHVANMVAAIGPVVIDRKDQTRLVRVDGDIAGRDLGSVAADVRTALATIPVPDNYDILIGGDFEEQQEAFSTLAISLLLALALVYMVMASLYESLRDPLIVMGSVPMALVGVVAMLWITGTTLNTQSLIGCVILIGVVVNNAILIVDQSNRLRAERYELHAALLEAGRRRLRPILMTAATTILALLPLAIGAGSGGEAQAPLARAVIGGLLVSTLITLVLIPVIYAWVHRRDQQPQVITQADYSHSS